MLVLKANLASFSPVRRATREHQPLAGAVLGPVAAAPGARSHHRFRNIPAPNMLANLV
jgi:hypothetical protein